MLGICDQQNHTVIVCSKLLTFVAAKVKPINHCVLVNTQFVDCLKLGKITCPHINQLHNNRQGQVAPVEEASVSNR